ncbi:putative Cell division cycle protein 48 [Paratrimastix pyriformis]|uniref:Cell division cycle protein 48 n=1 Tax=Paratrimastix pyriformis TaxID=342808 RepID=A0ABQ8UV45_9EUKA|nr:putative Cell division cycle protein 48 [Paratrimastix pyriformis]
MNIRLLTLFFFALVSAALAIRGRSPYSRRGVAAPALTPSGAALALQQQQQRRSIGHPRVTNSIPSADPVQKTLAAQTATIPEIPSEPGVTAPPIVPIVPPSGSTIGQQAATIPESENGTAADPVCIFECSKKHMDCRKTCREEKACLESCKGDNKSCLAGCPKVNLVDLKKSKRKTRKSGVLNSRQALQKAKNMVGSDAYEKLELPAAPPKAPQQQRRSRPLQAQPFSDASLFSLVCLHPLVPQQGHCLLCGAHGSGKTMFAQTLASLYPASHFHYVSCSQIFRPIKGDSENFLGSVFAQAEAHLPSCVVLDELDFIAPARPSGWASDTSSGADGGDTERRLTAFLCETLDRLTAMADRSAPPDLRVTVVGIAVEGERIAGALRIPGRLDHVFQLSTRTPAQRLQLLAQMTRGMRLAGGDPREILGRLAEETHGFVASDLGALCREAVLRAINRPRGGPSDPASSLACAPPAAAGAEDEGPVMTEADFLGALGVVRPSSLAARLFQIKDVSFDQLTGIPEAIDQLQVPSAIRHSPFAPLVALCPALPLLLPAARTPLWLIGVSLLPFGGRWRSSPQAAVVCPFRNPAALQAMGILPPWASLIHGPRAKAAGVNFIPVQCPHLLSKVVGESEKAVAALFREAREGAPSILFFDQIESLAPSRGHDTTSEHTFDRLLSCLLTGRPAPIAAPPCPPAPPSSPSGAQWSSWWSFAHSLDRVVGWAGMAGGDGWAGGAEVDQCAEQVRRTRRPGVMVLAATGFPEQLDGSLLRGGRVDYQVGLPLPDLPARAAILGLHTRQAPLDPACREPAWRAQLAARCEGWSGASLANLCREACMAALREDLRSQTVLPAHFEKALQTLLTRKAAAR